MSLLPSNEQAERALVASLLANPEYCRPHVMGLQTTDIVDPVARAVVEAFLESGMVDRIGLATEASERLGDPPHRVLAYIDTARSDPYDFEHAEVYVDLIREAARKARTTKALNQSLTDLIDGKRTSVVVPMLIEWLKENLEAKTDFVLADVIAKHEQEVYEYHADPLPPGEVRGISTGLRTMDELLGGLEPALYIVGASPSVGKTALGVKIGKSVAEHLHGTGKVSLYVTNEMNETQLLTRIACAEAMVKRDILRAGRLPDKDFARYYEVLDTLKDYPLELMYATQINDILQRAYSQPQPGVLIVDYLNKLSGGRGENRNQQFGSIASLLFDVANDLQIPVLLLAQLNRDIKQRGANALPQMNDLRDSGELEIYADVILMLHRETDSESDSYDPHKLLVIKRKDRLGGGQHDAVTLVLGPYGDVRDVVRRGYEVQN